MPNPVICRIGSALPLKDLVHYDPKLKITIQVDQDKFFKSFDMVRGVLQQRATANQGTNFVIPEYTPISDQGQAGSCVANACSDGLEIVEGIEQGALKVQQLSRRWLYYIARQYSGDTSKDDGTYAGAALHQLNVVGTFEEQYFPYSDSPDYITGAHSRPELDHYTMASNNRISGFYQLDPGSSTFLADMETAIRALHPIVFTMRIGSAFQKYRAGQVLSAPTDIIGGHAMLLTGVNYDGPTRRWVDRNSWSANWGDNGHALLDDSCVKLIDEAYVLTKMLTTVR